MPVVVVIVASRVFMSNKRGKFYQTKCVIGMDGWLKSLFCPKTLDS